MKTDLYTKIILTVIAIALVANVLKDVDLITTASAGIEQRPLEEKKKPPLRTVRPKAKEEEPKEEPERIIIDVNIVQINGKDIGHEDNKEQMPVYIKNSHVPVYYKGIPYVKVSNYYDFINPPKVNESPSVQPLQPVADDAIEQAVKDRKNSKK